MTAREAEPPPPALFGCVPARLEPLDAGRARTALAELAAAAAEQDLPRLAALCASGSRDADFLAAVFDLSPFLRGGVLRQPALLDALFDASLAERLNSLEAEIGELPQIEALSETSLMARLRRLKREAHLLIALDDLAQSATTGQTVRRLSALADACVCAAVAFLLRDAHRFGTLRPPDPKDPRLGSGWIVIAMGKLGARELNYSSDIDLIVFFDPDAPAIHDRFEANEVFTRLTRRLVRILQDRTQDGYVFRTDLRLRPDPGSTPLAIPIQAALNYYEGRGQNWERAAMIKARAVAGDLDAGRAFLAALQPYVWRKYMDFAAIADVHSIKRQIHDHRGHGEVAVAGHDVKLGRGGIREIEFFVQTQQLIAGGRYPELRGRETVAMLDALAVHRWIAGEARDELIRDYWSLRRVEHAIQMVNDEQSHVLPDDAGGLERIARLLGYPGAEQFSRDLRAALQRVERHYAALFETAPQLSAGIGNLVFTGEAEDPETLATLSQLGFERAGDISRLIRNWHYGRYRATRSAEARERLTELTPVLLKTFGQTRRADDAMVAFDAFLSGLPAGIQLFSLLQSNPALLRLLATIMGAAPRLAAIITRRPHVFDGLLDRALLAELPDRTYLARRLASFLEGSAAHEETLDRLRIFASEQKFLIGVRLLAGAIDAKRAGTAFSDLADLTIAAVLDAVRVEFEVRHGKVVGGRVAILGMGKLGSRELTAGSDVDLILLYDHAADAGMSDGVKPLAPSHYYIRMTQRLIAAVSAQTAQGVLYEVDLRLRPSGNKGPVATHIDSFRNYQRDEAWTWEHMALTRARVVAGDDALCNAIESAIASILAGPHDRRTVVKDALEMRRLIGTQKPPRDLWDVKLVPGGQIDLEFLAQVAVLLGQVDMASGRPTGTGEILERLDDGFADAAARHDLTRACALYLSVAQTVRLCLTGPFDRADVPPGLADLLARITDLPDIGVLEAHLTETARTVRTRFGRLLRAARQ